VYLFFDKDGSGVTNILSCREKLRKQKLYVCRFPKHRSDPAEMTREEVQRSIERALPIHEFMRRARNVKLTKEVLANG
jgi:DNA primase